MTAVDSIDQQPDRLELPNASASAAPAYWQIAPLPRAAVCIAEGPRLMDLSTAAHTALSAPLARMLKESGADTTTIAIDPGGEFWRLRRTVDSRIWLVQSLAASRLGVMEELRSSFSARLANSILHELRNPLNALTLQCDLLARTWKTATDGGSASVARIGQMKDRLKDLNERQNAVASLWLASGQEPTLRHPLDRLLEEILKLLRNHCAQRDLRLTVNDLAALGTFAIGPGATALQLALVAAVVWSADALKSAAEGSEIQVQGSIDERGYPLLKLPKPLAARGELRGADSEQHRWAVLALLLEKFSIAVERLPEGGVQLVFTAPAPDFRATS